MIESHAVEAGAIASEREEVRAGLTADPKTLPSKCFYDAAGSLLFERITELPVYYLTRAETSLLSALAPEIATHTGAEELVELGPGAARKTPLLLDAMAAAGRLRRYVPVEVSRDAVKRSAGALAARYPDLSIHAVVGDFERVLERVPPAGGRRMVAFLGSTIGNYEATDATALLARVRRLLRPGDTLLLGTDLVKSRSMLEAAYDDPEGVTAAFNRNMLRVVNRRFEGDIRLDAFDHLAFYDPRYQRVEMHLRCTESHAATLRGLGLAVRFEQGETIRTEVSCKYTRASVERLLGRAGLALDRWMVGPPPRFALSLSSPL